MKPTGEGGGPIPRPEPDGALPASVAVPVAATTEVVVALHPPLAVPPNKNNPFGADTMYNGQHLNLYGTMLSDAHGPKYAYFGKAAHPGYVLDHPHQGTDYPAPIGTDVLAMAPSVLVSHGYNDARGTFALTRWRTQAGGWVVLCEQHLSKILVAVGTHLAAGQHHSESGCSGQCKGPHCHCEMRFTTSATADWHYWQSWRAVNILRVLPGGDLATSKWFLPA